MISELCALILHNLRVELSMLSPGSHNCAFGAVRIIACKWPEVLQVILAVVYSTSGQLIKNIP